MTEDELRLLLRAGTVEPPDAPVDRIVAAGRRRGRRRLVGVAAAAVAAAAVVVLVTTFLRPVTTTVPAAASCAASVPSRALPDWARAGFSPPDQPMPYVLGSRGEIVAILFVELSQPPPPGQNNKILWVAREDSGAPLTITARHGAETVVRQLPDGPGPSLVDVPEPGCWTFDLSWGGHDDTLALRYGSG